MESNQKSDFAKMCRALRVKKTLKQREVASFIGVKPSTYGNTESSHWKVIGKDKVYRLVELHALDPESADRLIDAWERCPLSPYGEKQRKNWERRNRMRSKAKHHDRLFRSLVEVLGLLLPAYPHPVCACSFEREEACEVCMALDNLGLESFVSVDRTIDQLAKLADKLDAARAAEASGSPV